MSFKNEIFLSDSYQIGEISDQQMKQLRARKLCLRVGGIKQKDLRILNVLGPTPLWSDEYRYGSGVFVLILPLLLVVLGVIGLAASLGGMASVFFGVTSALIALAGAIRAIVTIVKACGETDYTIDWTIPRSGPVNRAIESLTNQRIIVPKTDPMMRFLLVHISYSSIKLATSDGPKFYSRERLADHSDLIREYFTDPSLNRLAELFDSADSSTGADIIAHIEKAAQQCGDMIVKIDRAKSDYAKEEAYRLMNTFDDIDQALSRSTNHNRKSRR